MPDPDPYMMNTDPQSSKIIKKTDYYKTLKIDNVIVKLDLILYGGQSKGIYSLFSCSRLEPGKQ